MKNNIKILSVIFILSLSFFNRSTEFIPLTNFSDTPPSLKNYFNEVPNDIIRENIVAYLCNNNKYKILYTIQVTCKKLYQACAPYLSFGKNPLSKIWWQQRTGWKNMRSIAEFEEIKQHNPALYEYLRKPVTNYFAIYELFFALETISKQEDIINTIKQLVAHPDFNPKFVGKKGSNTITLLSKSMDLLCLPAFKLLRENNCTVTFKELFRLLTYHPRWSATHKEELKDFLQLISQDSTTLAFKNSCIEEFNNFQSNLFSPLWSELNPLDKMLSLKRSDTEYVIDTSLINSSQLAINIIKSLFTPLTNSQQQLAKISLFQKAGHKLLFFVNPKVIRCAYCRNGAQACIKNYANAKSLITNLCTRLINPAIKENIRGQLLLYPENLVAIDNMLDRYINLCPKCDTTKDHFSSQVKIEWENLIQFIEQQLA